MPSAEKLAEFVHWCQQHLRGDEKGEAHIFLDHLFQALGWAGGLKDAGATLEMRVPKTDQGGVTLVLEWAIRRPHLRSPNSIGGKGGLAHAGSASS